MNSDKPEKRECIECKNHYPLNLFKVDWNICMYCEKGVAQPNRITREVLHQETFSSEKENINLIDNNL